jgi:undecaprenyl diphosphate synthase
MNFGGLRHIAIIMDGNGRWARARGRGRTRGHRAGAAAVRECVTICARADLPWLTLYALSTENFRLRPPGELRVLMALLRRFMLSERELIMEHRIRLRTIGRIEEFPPKVVREIRKTEELSAGNDGMVLCLALNYGGRSEIADAARGIAADAAAGRLDPAQVDEGTLAGRLYDLEMPDVDLMIRTAGELRISNFLIWQVAYGEIFVTQTLWPDFREQDLQEAYDSYRRRHRRFGGLLEGVDV